MDSISVTLSVVRTWRRISPLAAQSRAYPAARLRQVDSIADVVGLYWGRGGSP